MVQYHYHVEWSNLVFTSGGAISVSTGAHVEWSNLVFSSCGIILVSNGAHVEWSNLIFMRGNRVSISSVQQLNMENCTFQYITDYSAALTLSSVTSASITQCNFLNNINQCTYNNGKGGALYIYRSEILLSNDRFYGNSIYGRGYGGAIYSELSSSMTVRDSIFETNSLIHIFLIDMHVEVPFTLHTLVCSLLLTLRS